ncbi:hypothetical protein [Marinigracilibium pacificum]|uniref:Uncharacterized protein n=1 Tax=Marinigracilibium pacificum TaxID=2729599 RepID=A0A848IUX9_9BACT|nr:hypothetical protein [Marinigracilibium pacificum]NMM47031.1 hypothetical protein [Marinigracilibium pacificum]
MAKKNTLKDLNSFLNQQPKRLDADEALMEAQQIDVSSVQAIANAITELSENSNSKTAQLLSMIIETALENKENKSADDYLLLNCAAYLNAVKK